MNNDILKSYNNYIIDNTFKSILIRTISSIILLLGFIYNDIYIIKSMPSFYLRIILIIPLLSITIIKIFFKNQKAIIYYLYILTLFLASVMMYSKIIIHLNDKDVLFTTIVGAIVMIFILSLELKIKSKYSAIIYFFPFIVFVIVLYSYSSLNETYKILINIIPIVVFGFISNILFNKLLFKGFKLTYLLNKEKEVINKQNEELKILNKTKNRFFSIISHDLKNPFNIVMGFSNILSDNYNDYTETKRKHLINEINKSSTIIYNLLDNLLQWSAIQLNGVKLKKERINLFSLIKEVILTYQLNAENKNINIINNINNNEYIYSDKYSLITVIGNLINNAIKFSYENSKIKIDAKFNNNTVLISVKDYGVGINNDVKNKLFKIDENTNSFGTKKEKGTGLGLILCKEIIDANNGNINIESEEGKGTTFYVTIPSV